MLKRHSQAFLSFALLFDVLAVTAAWLVAYFLRFRLFAFVGPHPPALAGFIELLPIVVAANVVSLAALGLYRPPQSQHLLRVWMQILQASFLAWALLLAFLYFYSSNPYSRKLLALCLFLNPLALVVSRALLLKILSLLRPLGFGVRSVAIVGAGPLARKVLHGLSNSPWVPIHVDYLVSDESPAPAEVAGVPVLGSLSDLSSLIDSRPVDNVFVALAASRSDELKRVLGVLANFPLSVTIVPDLTETIPLNPGVGELAGMPVIQLRDTPIFGWRALAKRTLDIVGSVFFLVLLALPMLVLALLVKLTSRGPVIYRQERMSLGGKSFVILKFRSMDIDAETDRPLMSSTGDPRRTRLGVHMRRLGLDELPQLFNVLRGDMSLVGPRPERPHFIKSFLEEYPAYMLRHNVRAGMTGWAQVNGLRGDTSLRDRLQYDLYYLNNWSLLFDLFILVLTPLSLLFRKHNS